MVELVIVIVIVGILLGGIYSFLDQSILISMTHRNEFEFQSDLRDATTSLDSTIKASRSVYAMEQKDLMADEKFKYIAVIDDKTDPNYGQICKFEYDKGEGKWVTTKITESTDRVNYSLEFDPEDYEDESGIDVKKIGYKLTGTAVDNPSKVKSISTVTEVLNAFFVSNLVDSKTGTATILAYRTDTADLSTHMGRVTFVVDESGSMTFDIDDNNAGAESTRREVILNKALKNVVRGFYDLGINVDIGIVGFAQAANMVYTVDSNKVINDPKHTKPYLPVLDDKNLIEKRLDAMMFGIPYQNSIILDHSRINKKYRYTSTNIGDGLRVAYNNIDSMTNRVGVDYVILVTDGDPNFGTYEYTINKYGTLITHDFYYGDEDIVTHMIDADENISKYNYNLVGDYGCTHNGSLSAREYALRVANRFNADRLAKISGDKILYQGGEIDYSTVVNSNQLDNVTSFIITIGDDDIEIASGLTAKQYFERINDAMKKNNADEKVYFNSRDATDLNHAMEDIVEQFIRDYWKSNEPKRKK